MNDEAKTGNRRSDLKRLTSNFQVRSALAASEPAFPEAIEQRLHGDRSQQYAEYSHQNTLCGHSEKTRQLRRDKKQTESHRHNGPKSRENTG